MDYDFRGFRRREHLMTLAVVLAVAWIIPGTRIRSFLVGCGMFEGVATFLAVVLPILVLVTSANTWRMLWPCPRCGRAFQVSWLYGNAFARRCIHCGLPLGASKPKQKPKPVEDDFA